MLVNSAMNTYCSNELKVSVLFSRQSQCFGLTMKLPPPPPQATHVSFGSLDFGVTVDL